MYLWFISPKNEILYGKKGGQLLPSWTEVGVFLCVLGPAGYSTLHSKDI